MERELEKLRALKRKLDANKGKFYSSSIEGFHARRQSIPSKPTDKSYVPLRKNSEWEQGAA